MYWFWIECIIFCTGMLLIFSYEFALILFVTLYGEKIRQIIITMPEYKPTWFATVGLDKPIKPWHIIRVTFFVLRLMGVVFTKHTSIVNEEFKKQLPKSVITYLKWLQRIVFIGGILIFAGWGLIYLQQHGFLPN